MGTKKKRKIERHYMKNKGEKKPKGGTGKKGRENNYHNQYCYLQGGKE